MSFSVTKSLSRSVLGSEDLTPFLQPLSGHTEMEHGALQMNILTQSCILRPFLISYFETRFSYVPQADLELMWSPNWP